MKIRYWLGWVATALVGLVAAYAVVAGSIAENELIFGVGRDAAIALFVIPTALALAFLPLGYGSSRKRRR